MISRIVGTAGHIDHGKTELVRALTGVDTDRLKEEKERKISIDLGFAPLDLPGGVRAAVIDVPGHERFVKNMLAGVGGIDAVLFTIAADEGVMPQTSEHLEILHYLGVRNGVVVLTKADLVDEEMLDLVREEVIETLEGTTLEGAPILAASSITREGIDEVARTLAEILGKAPERPDPGWFRQPVDRVFSSRGFGTVVTGTIWSGAVKVGDRLELLPGGAEVRVRKVEVFNREVEEARAGRRTALALHGVSREEVIRGDTLVTPGILRPTHMIDARFSLAPSSKEMKNRQRIRFHHGAAEVLARVVLLEEETLKSGEEGFVQIRLEKPVAVARGDRFIIRAYSPARTIGGGAVLDGNPPKRKPAGRSDLGFLEISESGNREEMILSYLASSRKAVVPASEVAARLQTPEPEIRGMLLALEKRGDLRSVTGGVVLESVLEKLTEEIEGAVVRAGAGKRLRAGAPREEIRKGLGRVVEVSLFQALLAEMEKKGRISLRGEMILDGAGALPPKLEAAVARVSEILAAAGFAPPSPSALAVQAGLDAKEALSLLETLARVGRVVKVTPTLVYRTEEMERLRTLLREELRAKGTVTVAEFKDRAGLSRKYAVPLLEHFDTERITRRDGDRRVPGQAFGEEEPSS
ncbi:MAG: selenocysteine-specific translation elongation factor [Candidatus Eisenbacteria bacterium]